MIFNLLEIIADENVLSVSFFDLQIGDFRGALLAFAIHNHDRFEWDFLFLNGLIHAISNCKNKEKT